MPRKNGARFETRGFCLEKWSTFAVVAGAAAASGQTTRQLTLALRR